MLTGTWLISSTPCPHKQPQVPNIYSLSERDGGHVFVGVSTLLGWTDEQGDQLLGTHMLSVRNRR